MRGQAIWWYGQSASALIMEAFAIRDGIKLPCDIGLSKIIIETDANEVSIYGGTVLKVDQRYHPYFRRYKSLAGIRKFSSYLLLVVMPMTGCIFALSKPLRVEEGAYESIMYLDF